MSTHLYKGERVKYILVFVDVQVNILKTMITENKSVCGVLLRKVIAEKCVWKTRTDADTDEDIFTIFLQHFLKFSTSKLQ